MRYLRFLALPALAALAACASHDRANLTKFEPLPDGGFRYVVEADSIAYPPTDPSAEATRMQWLRSYISENGLCPGDFAIDDRRAILNGSALIGSAYTIYYEGRCI